MQGGGNGDTLAVNTTYAETKGQPLKITKVLNDAEQIAVYAKRGSGTKWRILCYICFVHIQGVCFRI